MVNSCTDRFPPRRFFGPSFGIGSALMTFDGGGAASLSMCFSILSRRASPNVPEAPIYKNTHRIQKEKKQSSPSLRCRSKSMRAARTDLAPTVRCTLSWYSGGVCATRSDWYMNPVCRRCVADENPAAIFRCAPSSCGVGETGREAT